MAEVVRWSTALSVSPLKSSQTVGASLAFPGIDRAIPMMHGSKPALLSRLRREAL